MGRYNSVNGVPSCANTDILTTKARLEWGFEGYITSDWYEAVPGVVCVPEDGLSRSCRSMFTFPWVDVRMDVLVWLSGAVSDVINTHHYTNTSDETCLAVLQAGMVRVHATFVAYKELPVPPQAVFCVLATHAV